MDLVVDCFPQRLRQVRLALASGNKPTKFSRIRLRALAAALLIASGALTGVTSAADTNSTSKSASATSATHGLLPANASASTFSDDDVIAYIDAQIRAGWVADELTPSAKASDGEWCRRVYLDLLGRVPTVDEIKHFQGDSSANKRAKLVDQLLGSKDYVNEYARNWATIYTIQLIGRAPARANRRDMVNRPGMQKYLRDSFAENKPYDKMAYELITAEGTTKPGGKNYNGATNYLVDKMKENGLEATAKTAKNFLGMQVQCTQCHNHPFNEWKQEQFWGMNSFFRQARATPTRDGRDLEYTTLEDKDFKGEGSTPGKAEVYYELRNGTLQVAYPRFVDGTKIDPNGYVGTVNRRQELGKLVIKSEYLGKAVVNRMWAHFLGYGFVKPIDDLGPHNAPSHPELLDRLGKVFADKGHDLRQLMRWITLSEAYSLSSKMNEKNHKDDPTLGVKPRFSHFYLRQIQAEQLYESLLVITDEHNKGDSYEEKESKKTDALKQFTLTFGNDDGEDATTFNGTIPQALMMMNGEMIKTATSTKPGSFLEKLARSSTRQNEILDQLFLATVARRPTSNDTALAKGLIASRGNQASGYQDVLWALLNCNEFMLIH
jgi:hypothetical protein